MDQQRRAAQLGCGGVCTLLRMLFESCATLLPQLLYATLLLPVCLKHMIDPSQTKKLIDQVPVDRIQFYFYLFLWVIF